MKQVFKIARNVKDGLTTTIIGSIIIAAALASIFYLEYTWLNVLPGLGLGVLLMCMPKSEKKAQSE